jgi:hypothetical protein
MGAQDKLFDEAKEAREPKQDVEIEQWLDTAPPAWRDNFLFLRANGISVTDALLIAWMALDRKSRKMARLETREHLADFLGVSRPVTYQWEERHRYNEKSMRYWADVLRVRAVAERLGDVDGNLYRLSVRAETNANMIALYYKRAGILVDESKLHLVGAQDGPVEIKRADELSDDELAAIAAGSGDGTAETTPGA